MAEQIGVKIREARLAAGMSQKALAAAIDGLSATRISEAERGLRELTDEQLVAIAEVTGSEALLSEVKKDAPETSVEEPEVEANPEPEAQPESQQDQNPLASATAMFGNANSEGLDMRTVSAVAGVLGNVAGAAKNGENPLAAAIGSVESLDAGTVAAIANVLGKVASSAK